MRVASSTLPGNLVQQLHDLGNRQNRLQTQAATGQRIRWGEEDPTAMRQALELRSEANANTQYGRNINGLQARLGSALDATQGIQKIITRAGEIATLADGTKSPQQLQAYAAEIDQLIRQAAQTANTRQGSEYIFGGTRTDRPPFVVADDAEGRVASVNYQGTSEVAELDIGPSTTVSVQTPGANAGTTGRSGLVTDARSGADLFNHLIAFRQHLQDGDTEAIAKTDRPALTQDQDHLLGQLAESGALQARLEVAASTLTGQATELRNAYSRVADADIAATITELTTTQTAYRAALQSGAGLLQTSLMDYLR